MQVLVMTSDNQYHCLDPFFHLWQKYYPEPVKFVICGFTPIDDDRFYSIGKFADYPTRCWSDALLKVLDEVADDVFMLMLGDYWLVRTVDALAVQMAYDYMRQFEYVIKFDLTTERLFADGGGKYLFGYNTYSTLGYLDLIKSDHGSMYHLSLWGGLWRRDLLRKVLVEGETAQQIEINGTGRLSQYGDKMLVLGTRQAPMKHVNVIQRGEWSNDPMTGLPALNPDDLKELKKLGYLQNHRPGNI